jgi:hypothetical protein
LLIFFLVALSKLLQALQMASSASVLRSTYNASETAQRGLQFLSTSRDSTNLKHRVLQEHKNNLLVVPMTEDGCDEVPDSEIRSTEGFAIPLNIKALIESKAQSVAVAHKQPTGAEESSNWDEMVVPITEDGCNEVPDSEIRSNSSKGMSGAEQVDVIRMRGEEEQPPTMKV